MSVLNLLRPLRVSSADRFEILPGSHRLGPFTQWHLIGWTPKAKGALAGCILAALVGITTIFWYSLNSLDEEDVLMVDNDEVPEVLEGSRVTTRATAHAGTSQSESQRQDRSGGHKRQ